ncbi:MAG: M28 family peptidase [Luteibaculaceae bacterium]
MIQQKWFYSRNSWFLVLLLVTSFGLISCGDNNTSGLEDEKREKVILPIFNEDSAYAFVQKQVDFGPRVPGTKAHKACAEWLEQKMVEFGAEVIVQHDYVKAYDGTRLPMYNIIAQYQPENPKRILLFAHWDTRHVADKEPARFNEPIDGADDGGSGVGVLLEMARNLQQQPTNFGIDIILFDVEDYGVPHGSMIADNNGESWCLGSQYWGKNPHVPNYRAKYGILLDMVGYENARFPKEGVSMHYAPNVVAKVWQAAGKLGYGHRFVLEKVGATIDDHLFVNRLRNIPSIVIVNMDPEGGYGHYHHTHKDNMSIISKETLKSVGEVLTYVIYNE